MLMVLLGAALYPLFAPHLEWMLLGLTLVGAGIGLAGALSRNPWVRRGTGLLVLEELIATGALFGTYPGQPERMQLVLAAGGVVMALWLLLRAPLPTSGLPLRGLWLRRSLAGAALLMMVLGSSWAALWQAWFTYRLPVWPLAPGLSVAALLLALAGRELVVGFALPKRAAAIAAS